jgi:NitT/TauT family transport system substrate-binding protein
MLIKILEAGGLKSDEVVVKNIPPEQQPAAWQAGQVDAAISYEPTASLLRGMGGVTLFDSREIPETIFDVLAVQKGPQGFDQDALRGLIRGHFRALEHIRINRQDAIYRIAARQQTQPANIWRALAGVVLPDLTANHRYLRRNSQLHLAAASLNRLMLKRGLLETGDDLEGLLDASYLPASKAH